MTTYVRKYNNLYLLPTAVGVEETFSIPDYPDPYYPYYGIAGTIAVNMIMAAASGGITAIGIAVWAQVYIIAYCASFSLTG